MKLTIITINYNNAAGLQKTMMSVLNQTSKEFEYIVVDGGSTDNSVAVIEQISKSTNKQINWISEKDNGIYHAMNKGIRMAQGEYVQFVNSGDCLASDDVTERMLAPLSCGEGQGERCAILYGNMLKIRKEGSVFYNKKIPNISMLTFYRGTINHSCAYIKRSLFDKYGLYDENLKIVSDWKWYLIAVGLNNEQVEYVDIDVTLFDMTGISETNKELDKAERREVLSELLPASVLKDYETYSFDIDQVRRIKRYFLTKHIFYFVERCLFKYEKMKSKYRREHLFFE